MVEADKLLLSVWLVVFATNVAMVAKPLPEVVLRCTTKLVSSLELSDQLRLILLDDVTFATKPVGSTGTVVAAASVVADASFENPELPALLVANTR